MLEDHFPLPSHPDKHVAGARAELKELLGSRRVCARWSPARRSAVSASSGALGFSPLSRLKCVTPLSPVPPENHNFRSWLIFP